MSAFTGEHSSGPVPRESSCHRSRLRRRCWRPRETRAGEAREAEECDEEEPCSAPGPRPKVGLPTEAEDRWIIKREDDSEEESPQSNDETAEESPQSDDETAEKFAKLHDAEAGGSAVMADLKTHTDKYSAEDVKQALERSQEEIS